MTIDREALRKRLQAAFREEAAERLRVLNEGLSRWRQGDIAADSIESLFREVHSLKGAARSASLPAIEQLCHAWESVFAVLKRAERQLDAELIALCWQCHKAVQALCVDQPVAESLQAQLRLALEAAARGESVSLPTEGQATAGRPTASGPAEPELAALPMVGKDGKTVRVTVDRLDNLLFLGESLLQIRLETEAHAQDVADSLQLFGTVRSHRNVVGGVSPRLRGALEQFPLTWQEPLRSLLDYVDWSLDFIDQLHFRSHRDTNRSAELVRHLRAGADSLNQELQSVLLLPCQTLCDALPAQVLDLGSQLGKQVKVQVQGSELQVDKRVLDELQVVLQHLVRNAVDHAIETPVQRRAAGKPEQGLLRIEWLQEYGDRFELRLSDDGAGIDPEALKARALASGVLTPAQAENLSAEQAQRLVFQSGLSTSAMVTDLSGRGLGLAIVQEKVERLGGRIDLASQPGRGTTFRLHLPLTIATFRVVLVRAGGHTYGIPALTVERCLRLPNTALRRVENRATVIVDDAVLPLWPLAEVLGVPETSSPDGDLLIVVLVVRGECIALLIDELIDDQEITLKSLGKQLQRVRNVLGATVLGDGQLVPVLHPQDLHVSARTCAGVALAHPTVEAAVQRRPRILVAEDSFTSRGLLKAILEGAGYEVMTASDGLEAWNALKQSAFDLLVSDVEMPKLDGFSLTGKIRLDRALSALPVVLVTALQSPDDRARGLDVGANAYLVKSSFEQDNLLDAIRRLL